MKNLFKLVLILCLTNVANALVLPLKQTGSATLKVFAYADCNYSNMAYTVDETENEIIFKIDVREPGRAGCIGPDKPVIENLKINLTHGMVQSDKTLVVRGTDRHITLLGIEMF